MPWSSQVKRHVHAWSRMVNAEPAAVDAAIDRLVDLALAWESSGGLRPLSGVAEGLSGGAGRRSQRAAAVLLRRAGACGGRRAARRAVRAGAGDARARARLRRRGDHRRRPAHAAARGRHHPGRGAALPTAAGPPGHRHGRGARRGRAGPARRPDHRSTASTTSRRWPPPRGPSSRSTAWLPGPRSTPYAGSSSSWTCGAPSRRPRCAAVGSGVRDLKATATALHLDQADAGAARRDRVVRRAGRDRRGPGRQPGLAADRRGRRLGAATAGRAVGRAWPARGWPARGCPAWWARATRRARRGTPWLPSWPACTWPRRGR